MGYLRSSTYFLPCCKSHHCLKRHRPISRPNGLLKPLLAHAYYGRHVVQGCMEMKKIHSQKRRELNSSCPRPVFSWRKLILLILGLFPIQAHSALFPPGSYIYSPTRTYYASILSKLEDTFNTPYPDFASAGQAIADAYIPPMGTTKTEGWSIALGTLACNQGNVEPLAGGETFSVTILGYYQRPDGGVTCSRGGWVIVRSSCPYGGGLLVDTLYPLGVCVRPSAYTITLTGGNEVEPSKGSDIKSLPLIATVKDQSTGQPPTTPVTVKVSIKVEDPKSGGHDHGDSTRPRGGIADVEKCLSDDTCKEWTLPANNGVVEFNFKAPEASGIHTITATCVGCTNTATKPVDVKVDGLKPIPASAFYAFIGGGVGKPHQGNHYLTPTAAAVLWEIAIAYQVNPQFKWRDRLTGQLVSPPILHVNDASIEWGGVFDAVNANWMPPHHEHRQGVVVDLRANDAPGAIPPRNFIEFDTYLDTQQIKYLHECAKDKKGTPPASRHNRLWPGCISKLDGSMDINRHYHVRLLGVSE